MFNSSFKIILLLYSIILISTSCITDSIQSIEGLTYIEWTSVSYNQINNQLFIQLEAIGEDFIDSVNVQIISNTYDSYSPLGSRNITTMLCTF